MKLAEAIHATLSLFLGLGIGLILVLFVQKMATIFKWSFIMNQAVLWTLLGIAVFLINLNGGILKKEWFL